MRKKYDKPKLEIHGDIHTITKKTNPKGPDGSDTNGGASL